MTKLNFTPVTPTDDHIEILYDLLKNRDHSISHQSLPPFEGHANFVRNHPYREWFLIQNDDDFIGSVYITDQNTIGVPNLDNESKNLKQVIDYILENYDPLPPLPSIRSARFVMNVPTGHTDLQKAVVDTGAKMIQTTYRF